MWLFKKLREVEWMVSLWTMATTSAWFWVVVSAVVAVLTAIGTVAYDWAVWINSFGRSGWILAVAATIPAVAVIVGLVAWAIDRIRVLRRDRRSIQHGDVAAKKAERERTLDETLRLFNRSVFLLLANAVDEGTHRALWKAFKTLPDAAEADTDEKHLEVAARFRAHEGETALLLRGTRWSPEFSRIMAEVEYAIDVDLRRAKLPDGIQPMIYRAYAIASGKRDARESFLKNAIAASDGERDHILGMLREQRALHDKR